MLRVNAQKWGQSAAMLRETALSASHPRTRERLMALYEVCEGKSATQVGQASGRNPQTVMDWVHRYNADGPAALLYRHTGGHHPPLCLLKPKQR